MNDIGVSLITFVTTLVTVLTTIISSKALTGAVIRWLVGFTNGSFISHKDLSNHDLFIKINKLLIGAHLHRNKFDDEAKSQLFSAYIKILSVVFDKYAKQLLDPVVMKYDEQTLKSLCVTGIERANNEIVQSTIEHLLTINNDLQQAQSIAFSIEETRSQYFEVFSSNIANIAGQTISRNNAAKIFSIFSVYLITIDNFIIEAVNSFNEMNGSLEKFLRKEKNS